MQNESTTTGRKAREKGEGKERVSKMCLTAGVCVGVMGDPAGPRGNLQVCAFRSPGPRRCAAAEMSQLLFYTHTHIQMSAHKMYRHREDKQVGMKL